MYRSRKTGTKTRRLGKERPGLERIRLAMIVKWDNFVLLLLLLVLKMRYGYFWTGGVLVGWLLEMDEFSSFFFGI